MNSEHNSLEETPASPTRRAAIGAAVATAAVTAATATASGVLPAAAQNAPAAPATPPAVPPPGTPVPAGVTGKEVTFQSGDAQIKGYLALPPAPAKQGVAPAAIIVIHEIWGLNEHIRDVARRLAGQGYMALAPDLYSREGAPKLDPANRAGMMEFLASISDDRMVADLDAGLGFLQKQGAVWLGSIGFCMGGLYSYLLAAKSEKLHAAVDFYGRILYDKTTPNKPVSPIDYADKLRCPLLANFGETDQSITVAHVEQLRAKLAGSRQPWKVNIYPGAGHAFFNDTRPSYNPAAAKDAWGEVTTFFRKHLETPR